MKTFTKNEIIRKILKYLLNKQDKTLKIISEADYSDTKQRDEAQQAMGGDHAISELIDYLEKALKEE